MEKVASIMTSAALETTDASRLSQIRPQQQRDHSLCHKPPNCPRLMWWEFSLGGLIMPIYDDERERMLDDEHPGPQVLESALAHTSLSEVVSQPALMVSASATLADAIRLMQAERRA